MKVRCEIDVDLESGDYEMRFRNVSQPGARMDFVQIQPVMRRVFEDVARRQTGGAATKKRA